MGYAPVGRCIYCGSQDNRLGREHIIPLALSGDLVLPAASCRACEKVTGGFEQRVLQGPLLSARAALELRTRRPDRRPTTFPIRVCTGAVEVEVEVNAPLDAYPQAVILPMYDPPRYFQHDDAREGVSVSGFYLGHVGTVPAEVLERCYPGADGISVEGMYPVVEFARMIAKIGYSYAVAELGLDHVVDPLVLPAIRGLTNDIGMWVGTIGDDAFAAPADTLHRCGLLTEHGVIALVQLFALQPSPLYAVAISEHPPSMKTGASRGPQPV